jgi:hypothetical protein
LGRETKETNGTSPKQIGADVDYGIKKADGGLMRNIKNIDEESANELQSMVGQPRFHQLIREEHGF